MKSILTKTVHCNVTCISEKKKNKIRGITVPEINFSLSWEILLHKRCL